MARLERIALDALRDALTEVETATGAKRLVAAIAYKNGVTQTELADWFDVERKTIYNWFVRLEDGDLLDSATDDSRPGRNRKLSDDEWTVFRNALYKPPEDAGFDDVVWSPKLAREYLRAEFDVEYSLPSCRRLMKEAGLTYTGSRRTTATIDPDDGGAVQETTDYRSGVWTPR